MWFGVFLMRLTQFLPLSWQMKLGKGLGRLVMKFAAGRTHTARRNLTLCFPDMSETERGKSAQT